MFFAVVTQKEMIAFHAYRLTCIHLPDSQAVLSLTRDKLIRLQPGHNRELKVERASPEDRSIFLVAAQHKHYRVFEHLLSIAQYWKPARNRGQGQGSLILGGHRFHSTIHPFALFNPVNRAIYILSELLNRDQTTTIIEYYTQKNHTSKNSLNPLEALQLRLLSIRLMAIHSFTRSCSPLMRIPESNCSRSSSKLKKNLASVSGIVAMRTSASVTSIGSTDHHSPSNLTVNTRLSPNLT